MYLVASRIVANVLLCRLKLKRPQVVKRFRKELDELYAEVHKTEVKARL